MFTLTDLFMFKVIRNELSNCPLDLFCYQRESSVVRLSTRRSNHFHRSDLL